MMQQDARTHTYPSPRSVRSSLSIPTRFMAATDADMAASTFNDGADIAEGALWDVRAVLKDAKSF